VGFPPQRELLDRGESLYPSNVRRTSERYGVDLRVEVEGNEVVVDDLSASGMYLAAALPVGGEIELKLDDTHCRAVVVHRDDGGARPAGVGVAFTRPQAGFVAAIDRLLQRARRSVTSGHVVVGDPEARVAARLSGVLGTAGFTVATATNGMEVLGACTRRLPSSILVDCAMPTIDGFGLLEKLACEAPNVPVIMMARDGAGLARAFDRGAADFLAKPFSTLEVIARVRRLALAPQVEQVVLAGNLRDVGVPAVVQLLEQERKTGRLVLKHGHTAWIDLVDGRIVDAGWSLGEAHARNVVFSVLDWPAGSFKLLATSPRHHEATIGMSITHLLLEHARLRDEASEQARSAYPGNS
jgi:CheY-like chemotaxis protein